MEHVAAAAAKTEVRGTVLAARRSLPAEVRQQAAVRVQAALLALVRATRPEVIAGYVPMLTEPGGADLPDVLAAHGRLLLPVLRTDLDLDWAYFAGPGSLAGGRLREPRGPRLGLAAIGEADLVVVPAVAVDRTGVRLGRGGGSYDRALGRVRPDAVVVAPLYDGELVGAVPAEPHDARVGAVVLPSAGLVRLPVSSADDWTDSGPMAQY